MSLQGRYSSVLAEAMEQFLAHKRALGRCYDTEERHLLLLDRFLVAEGIDRLEGITPEILEAFLLSRPRHSPKSHNQLLGAVRRLLDWMVVQEMLAHSPLRGKPRRETGPRLPVILDPPLVRALLDLAAQLPDRPRAPLRGASYRLAFALMYGLGLRVGEVSHLEIRDVDLPQKLLQIRDGKFRKSRLLPFGPRLGQALEDFLALRSRRWGRPRPRRPCSPSTGSARSAPIGSAPPSSSSYPGSASGHRATGAPGLTTCATPSPSAPCCAGIERAASQQTACST